MELFINIWLAISGVLGVVLLMGIGMIINGIVLSNEPGGHYDFNIFRYAPMWVRILTLLIVGIIFPPSMIWSIIILVFAIADTLNRYRIKLDLVIKCKSEVRSDGDTYTKCGAHISPLAETCPICKHKLEKS